MSVDGAVSRAVLLRAVALYVAVVGVSMLIVRIGGGGAWPSWAAFLAGSAGVAVITAALTLPRLRHLHQATAGADALASGRFDLHLPATDDEFAPLTSALNTASATISEKMGALRHERAQLASLLNASSDATVAIDRSGAVVYLNDAAMLMFARAGGEGVGRQFIELVRDFDLNDLLVAAAQRGERSVRVVAYGQTQRWLQATAVPIDDAGAWAALAVFHDLTEVRRLEGMRRDFISNVSHELRTPLAGIRAAAETLQEGAIDDRPAAIEFMGHIQREVDRMTQLVEELLELSRIESGASPLHFAHLDASVLVADAARRFARQAERAGVRLTSEVAAGTLPIIGDGERLERAIGNLVANAIKFTPAGGAVTVGADTDGGSVAISVTDTGIGMEPEQRARVFERFYKADRSRGDGGTGLGLAIVKHIALAHEGNVAVESRPGRGSTFTMRLPRR